MDNRILQRTSFTMDGKEYLVCLDDIAKLYNADKEEFILLDKLTFTSVYQKPLLRKSVPLVCKVNVN